MKRPTWCRVAAAGLVTLMALPAAAQQSRLRTLTYDREKQTWVETAPPRPGTPEGDLYVIRQAIIQTRFRRASSRVKSFIKEYGTQHPLYAEVLIAKAEALVGRRHYEKAHETLQEFLAAFNGTPGMSDALRLEFIIAESFLKGEKRKFLGLRVLSGEELGLEILGELSAEYPGNEYAELALKTRGDYLFRTGDHALAELDYNRLIREYPRSRYHQYALKRAAEAALASFGGVRYDEAPIVEASERFREYRNAYPGEADRDGVGLVLDSIREMRADKEFRVGRYYERTDHLSSAVYYYELVRRDWPGTVAASRATRRLELLGVLEAVPAPPADEPSDS